jgi:hypothetical protein
LVGGGGQLGRGGQIESQRHVLCEVKAAIGKSVFTNVAAEGVPTGAGSGGGSNLRIDLFANPGAYGAGDREVGVVPANVEGYGDVEKRLAGFKGNGGATRLRLCNARRGL